MENAFISFDNKIIQEFFKVFLLRTGSDQLQIPKSFTNFFKGITPCKATLVDQDKNFWDILVDKIEGRLVFKRGWKQFAKEKGLEEGDFLVFQYDGKSTFYVNIFSKTGCRKVPARCERVTPIVILDEDTDLTCNNNKIQRGLKRKHPLKGLKINEKSASEGPSKVTRSKLKGVYEDNDNHCEKKPHPAKCAQLLPKCVPLQNPHFEICFDSPWRLKRVEIPRGLLSKLNIRLTPKIHLRDEKDRLWPVAITSTGDRHFLGNGWFNFWRSNNIQQGQRCDFQFVLDKENVVLELLVTLVLSWV